MILNYIKIAWRNLVKQKLYSLINIIGLATGLAVCMLIMLYVSHEMSYDRFHKNADRIFNPHAKLKIGGNTMNMAYMSYASGPLIKQSQPSVESYMRTLPYFKPFIVSKPNSSEEKYQEDKLLFADPGFFNFFSFKLVSGSAADVLNKPFSIVLSQDMAKKYFGDTDPIGKTLTLRLDTIYTYQVTGVAENAPSNSSIEFNFIVPNQSLLAMKEAANYTGKQQIGIGSFNVYLLLKHGGDTSRLINSMNLAAKKDKAFDDIKFSMQSLPDTHLKDNFGDSSNTKYLKIFPLVAILILLLALVNYMSLSTARATLRAKEVGVRKISGASRKTIATQFYVESALFACISFAFGYFLCYLFKPWFFNILQLKIDNSFLYSPLVLFLLFALLVITIILSGSYPSVVLSAFKPAVTLKGKMSRQAGGVHVRKVFTLLQFAISTGLIVCGIVIDKQLYFFRHTDTGVDRENVVMIPIGKSVGKNYPSFKHDVQSLAGVSNVATSHYAMFKGYDMFWASGNSKEQATGIASLVTDKNFITTLALKWKYPPVANSELASRKKVLINESAIEQLHLPLNPVGTFLQTGDSKIEVAGVIKDFNFSSLQSAITPLAINIANDTDAYFNKWGCNLFVKIKPHTNLPATLNIIHNLYKKYDQDTPFSYSFMDDAFNEQYKAEDRLASIFSVFTAITIVLATLGLFGLAAFTIQQRAKEIGVRKVLGASLASINILLSLDFLKLVVFAVIIASPVAWWAMHNWLQTFAYRIAISWWIFAAAGMIAVVTAIITTGYHALKASIANPINSLRNE